MGAEHFHRHIKYLQRVIAELRLNQRQKEKLSCRQQNDAQKSRSLQILF